VRAHDLLSAREYALFAPQECGPSGLAGYRRGEEGRFVPWPPDDEGGLWSAMLGLGPVAHGTLLQAETAEGRLLTPEQKAAERRRAETERHRAEEERRHEAEARRQAEAAQHQAEATRGAGRKPQGSAPRKRRPTCAPSWSAIAQATAGTTLAEEEIAPVPAGACRSIVHSCGENNQNHLDDDMSVRTLWRPPARNLHPCSVRTPRGSSAGTARCPDTRAIPAATGSGRRCGTRCASRRPDRCPRAVPPRRRCRRPASNRRA
jgi:hypothetical protein